MNKIGDKNLVIYRIGSNQTIDYAAEELKKYLSLMCQDIVIDIKESEKYDATHNHALWVGEYNKFTDRKFLDVENPQFDDAITISVQQGEGIITGVNPRSVLIGVYQFLTECGCRFLRPGADGEIIPKTARESLNAEIAHKPSYRHRGLCIEGAVSYENVFDIIEWSPKVGFNSYFIQFREAYIFFERWYKHKLNPEMQEEEFPVESAREHVKKLGEEIVKRGMIYHAVGHGWTCEPLGIPGLGWEEENVPVPEETKQYLALVNGKRELWTGVPLYTSLCYSSRKVQELMVESIVDYLKMNRSVDILHFWLADGTNNHCECENCKDTRPSDFYVQMLNKLDERLTQEKIDTKIVFLIYVDLFWPPEKESIKNQERFIMMFAPFDRVYDRSFVTKESKGAISNYNRNNIDRPSSIPENLAYLEAWQKMFKGDSFDFDYHFMWAHFYDPGYFKIAQTLYEDIVNLKNIGLNGYISCQLQRTFLPTGFGMYVMAKTLWDATVDFEDIKEEYFQGSFGDKGSECREYLEKLSDMFYPSYISDKTSYIDEKEAARFEAIIEYVKGSKSFIEDNMNSDKECHALSYRYLKYHAEMVLLYAGILEARARKDRKRVETLWRELRYSVQKEEKNIQRVFDVFEFIDTMDKLFKDQ
jgi:hypothetical protein